MFNSSILKFEEKAIFSMREIFIKNGYRQFKMSKFEEYDLYSKNKDFLVSDGVITFNDTNGKLLALKPDVTLSIIKNSENISSGVQKYFYNESVYRISDRTNSYKEILQTGLECIGEVNKKEVSEVTSIAIECLKKLSSNCVLMLSDVEFVNLILNDYLVSEDIKKSVIIAITNKNSDELLKLLDLRQFNAIKCLINTYENADLALLEVEKICISTESKDCLNGFKELILNLKEAGYGKNIGIDFAVTNTDGYYSKIVFKGFINGVATKVLSGGQYDKLMQKMGRNGGAIGFAVYLDDIERETNFLVKEDNFINVALPKGRLGEKVYDMFEKAGYGCPSIKENSRKLIFENKENGIRFFWVKPSDVTIYVERGSADIGVAGKDILLEYSPDVFELLDLNVGKCKMAVASKKDFIDDPSKTLRVATKFSNIAKKYYAEKCRDIDVIHLNGSIEIAPILGLSDVIVDIVETGKTLLENELKPFETIVPISARLIANKSSFEFKAMRIEKIKKELSKQVKRDD